MNLAKSNLLFYDFPIKGIPPNTKESLFMKKKLMISEIKRMVKKCSDDELIQIIYLLLVKATVKDFNAERCSGDNFDIS